MTATECLEGVGSLVLSAEGVDLAASGARLPTVSIVAYTGGIMKVPGWGEIVIDLAGLDVAGGVAILSDHDSSRRGVVGHGSAQVKNNRLIVTGSISATGQAAREIVDASKNGFPWQASVGVEVIERHAIRAGKYIEVNGKHIKAPAAGLTLVTRGRLREVSIVGIGCDGGTAVSIAASLHKQTSMEAQVQDMEVPFLIHGRRANGAWERMGHLVGERTCHGPAVPGAGRHVCRTSGHAGDSHRRRLPESSGAESGCWSVSHIRHRTTRRLPAVSEDRLRTRLGHACRGIGLAAIAQPAASSG
jgi:hypothetical protein